MMKHHRIVFIIVGIVLLLAGGVWWTVRTPHWSQAKVRLHDAEFTVDVANSSVEQRLGLQHRTEVPEGTGMLFQFPRVEKHAIWMKNTLVPLDIVWINQGKIVYIKQNVQPQPGASDRDLIRYLPSSPADSVLELPAGTLQRLGVKKGDSITVID